jgi:hypothetical protein
VPVLAFGDLREYNFFFVEWGETQCLLNGLSNVPVLPTPDDRLNMEHYWNAHWHAKTKVHRENLPLYLPTTNPTCTALGLNPGLHTEVSD